MARSEFVPTSVVDPAHELQMQIDSMAVPTDASAAPVGPGWYESSWDLQHGLEVSEGLPSDASLHEWLEHHLCMPRSHTA
jgi:hypothetical protein